MDDVYIADGLLTVLLEAAKDAEPQPITIGLQVTRTDATEANEDLPPGTPVFTHFYHPSAGQSVTAVFGMDVGTPVGTTRGRFLSHPDGERTVRTTDDLHAVLVVAVPPWDRESIAAYDRRGRRCRLRVVDVTPPSEALP